MAGGIDLQALHRGHFKKEKTPAEGPGLVSCPEIRAIRAVRPGSGDRTPHRQEATALCSAARFSARRVRAPGPERDARQRSAPPQQGLGLGQGRKLTWSPQPRSPVFIGGLRTRSHRGAHGGAAEVPAGFDLRLWAAESRRSAAWRPRIPVSDTRSPAFRGGQLHLYCEDVHRLAPGWR